MSRADWPELLVRAKRFRLPVSGESMVPALRPGDEIECEPCTVEALRPGQIAVWYQRGGIIAHRYLGRRAGRLITRGDHTRSHDPAWEADRLLGRAVARWRCGARRPFDRGVLRWRGLWTANFWRTRSALRTSLECVQKILARGLSGRFYMHQDQNL
jgi:hypothetical protein